MLSFKPKDGSTASSLMSQNSTKMASSSTSGTSETVQRIPRTRRALYEAIESHQCSITPTSFKSQICGIQEDLSQLLSFYKPPSETSKQQVEKEQNLIVDGKTTSITSKDEKEFVYRLSRELDLDQVQAFQLLRSCIRAELQAPAALAKFEWKAGIQYDNHLLEVVRNHYFAEREATLLLITAICRAADYPDHPFNQSASEVMSFLISKAYTSGPKSFEERVLDLFEKTITASIPKSIQSSPDISITWAFQNLKEQRCCLELLILMYYERLKCSATRSVAIYKLLLKFNMGMKQVNRPLFDANSMLFYDQVCHLCGVLAIEVLNLELVSDLAVLKSKSGADCLLHESPAQIAELHECVWNSLLMGASSSKESSILGLLALGWASFAEMLVIHMNSVCEKDYRGLYQTFTETHKESHSPQFLTQYGYIHAKGIEYLSTCLNGPLYCDADSNEMAYRSIMKGFLTTFFMTHNVSNLPGRDKLVACTSYLFSNQPELCEQFWDQDYPSLERRSLLEATRRLFPLEFSPFTQLLRSLIGNASTALYAIKLLKDNFCFADHIRESDYEYSFEMRPQEIVTWRGRGLIYGADRIPFAPPPKTVAHVIGQSICVLEFRFSTWHVFQSFLDSFLTSFGTMIDEDLINMVHIGTPAICLEIIQLFNKVFQHAEPEVLRALIEHVGEIPSSNETKNLSPAERFIGLIGQVLNRCCMFSIPPTELITACIETFRILLPHYPRIVWKHLRAQQLLPQYSTIDPSTSTTSFSSDRPMSYMQQVVLPQEASQGSYNATTSFLCLVKDLIVDAQKIYEHGSTTLDPKDIALEKELALASTNASRMRALELRLGGREQVKALEKRLWQSSQQKELSIIQSDVVYSCAVFIHNQILSSFGSWRYQQLNQKFLIVVHMLQIFNLILEDVSTVHSTSSPLRLAYQFLCKTYVESASPDQLSPILDIVGLGSDSPLHFYRMHRRKEASSLESMILESLKFVKNILIYRLSIPSTPSLLDNILTNRTVEISGKRMELIHVISTYIYCEYNRDLPRIGTELLTLLCNLASLSERSGGQSISFVGYFGDDAFTVVSSLVSMVDDELLSSVKDDSIQEAIYSFTTAVIMSQPALGAMFLSGKSGQSAPSVDSLRQESRASSDSITQEIPKSSILHPILLVLKNWKQAQEQKPRVLAAVLRLLDTIWASAKEHHGTLQKLRKNSQFWSALKELLSATNSLSMNGEISTNVEKNVSSRCYLAISQAYALKILALEGFFLSVAKMPSPPEFIQTVKTVVSQGKSIPLFLHGPQFEFKPSLTTEAQELASRVLSGFQLADFQARIWHDFFKSGRLYGDSYVYDISSLETRLEPRNSDPRVSDMLNMIRLVNINFSLTDAYIVLVRSWILFCQMTASRLWNQVFSANAPQVMYQTICSLIEIIRGELPDGSITDIYRNEVSALAGFMIGKWIQLDIQSRKDLSLDSTNSLDPFVDLLNQCTMAFETERFPLGPAGRFSSFGFHEHLLESILLLVRGLKLAVASFGKSDQLETIKSKRLQQVYPILVPIIMQGFSYVMMARQHRLIGEVDSVFEKDVALLSSVIIQLIGPNDLAVSPSIWHPVVERYEVLQQLLSSFTYCSEAVHPESGLNQHLGRVPILHILDCLVIFASHPIAAERLAVYGAISCMCSNGLTSILKDGDTMESIRSQDPVLGALIHESWCQMLTVVTKLIRSLNHHPQILTESIGFLKLYESQFVHAFESQHQRLTFQPSSQLIPASHPIAKPSLRKDDLEEIRQMTDLLYRYALGADSIGARGSDSPIGRDFAYVCGYQDFALHLLARLAHLFVSPKELMKSILGQDNIQTDSDMNTSEIEDTKDKITELLIHISRNLILFVGLTTNARSTFSTRNSYSGTTDGSSHPSSLVLHPSMSTFGDAGGASFGTVFELLRYNISSIQSYLSGPTDFEKTIQQKPEITERVDSLLVSSEAALTLLISQLMILLVHEKQDGGQSSMMEDYASREIFAELQQTFKDVASLLENLSKQAVSTDKKTPNLVATTGQAILKGSHPLSRSFIKEWRQTLSLTLEESRMFLSVLEESAFQNYH